MASLKILTPNSNYVVGVLSRDQSLVTLAFRSVKFTREIQFYKDLTRKTGFLNGGLASSCIN